MPPPLTSSIYTFEDLRKTGALYIDKTAFIHKLVTKPKGTFFLARPRRFGKSLALSTLKAIFQGKRELFKGLAIDNLEYDWKVHPVIHLDMSLEEAKIPSEVSELLHEMLDEYAESFNVSLAGRTPASRFKSLIKKVHKDNGPVVILIDEYDRAILHNLKTPKEALDIRSELQAFYGITKVTEPYQRFLFITGVASFAKVSFFSDLNHVLPISRNPDYATMLGYTQEEFEENFADYITVAAEKNNLSREEFLEKFKTWYNGFRFEEEAPTVYNPVSTAQFFENKMKFQSYWSDTGNSKFLIELAQRQNLDFSKQTDDPIPAGSLDYLMLENLSALPLLFQSGYFTIRSADTSYVETQYQIGFPNLEIEFTLEKNLLPLYLPKENENEIHQAAKRMRDALLAKDYAAIVAELNAQLASIPGKLHVKTEPYYHTVATMFLRFAGAMVRTEEWVSTGIIDNTVAIGNLIYVFEFKTDKTAAAAMKQIHDKNYYAQWLTSGKKIILFAMSFDTEKKCVSDYLTEEPN
jgi:hypothetical protein